MRGLLLLAVAGCAVPPPAVEPPRPVSVPTVVVENGSSPSPVLMGVGGSGPALQDLCWLLFRDRGRDPDGKDYDRSTLCLYRARGDGRGALQLVGVREVSFDARIMEYQSDKPHVKEVWETMKREESRRK